MAESVTVSRDGDVAIVTIDNPPVNALSFRVRDPLDRAVSQYRQRSGQPVRRTKTVGQPMLRDSPCRDRKISVNRSRSGEVAAASGTTAFMPSF